MRQNRLCGYDLNGWRDVAARQWIVRPGGDVEYGETHLTDASLLSSLVRTGDGKAERWIGGVQADLAPHGRGGGWGLIGDQQRRRAVRHVIEDDAAPAALLGAAIQGLVPGPTHSIYAIQDVPETTERLRERLLAGMNSAKLRSSLLVWRPVLAVLHALETGRAASSMVEGTSIGVIGQGTDGLSLQVLRLRREAGRSRTLLAPERRSTGTSIPSEFSLARLVERAEQQVARQMGRPELTPQLRSVGRLALGLPTSPEILRLPNGDWEVVEPPAAFDLPLLALSPDDLVDLADCAVIFLDALAEGEVRESLIFGLETVLGRTVEILPVSAVAEGGLVAAARLAANEPIYFDFLPKVSTIVQTVDGAANYDLVHADETLLAGRLYRSPKPARLAIQAGQRSFSVHLRKEAERWPRKAIVELGTPLDATTPVDLWVEQSPAAGRAKIFMQAPKLSRQFSVDWDTANEIEADWDTIIADLAAPLPTIPKRLVLPCGLQPWTDTPRGPGLASILSENVLRREVDWKALANQLSLRPEGRYCISSDGHLPESVPHSAVEHLEALTRRAALHLRDRLAGAVTSDSQSLRFLTWQFRRCPGSVADAVVETVVAGPPYRFFPGAGGLKLLFQGLGRVTRSEAMEQAVLHCLMQRVEEWEWYRESACAAFILSRSDTAPLHLSRRDVESIAKVVQRDFELNLGTDYTKFLYAPFLLVGLLRWRLKERHALVAGLDPVATAMARVVEKAIEDLSFRSRPSARFIRAAARYRPILVQTLAELEGEGSNPDLLLDIYGGGE